MRLLIPNLSFEDELSGRPGQLPVKTKLAINDLAPVFGLLAEDGDVVWLEEIPEDRDVPACLAHVRFATGSEPPLMSSEVVPFGWTQTVRSTAERFNLLKNPVPLDKAVQKVNGRAFNAGWDMIIGKNAACLPFCDRRFGRLCPNMNAVQNAVSKIISSGYERWVAKPQISHAGRNRLIMTGANLNEQQMGWLKKHLKHPDGVYLEPWVDPTAEAGLQFQISALDDNTDATESRVQLVGVTELLNDRVGRYRGSFITSGAEIADAWEPAIAHGFAVCRAAADMGYFGPIGIDAFQFTDTAGTPAVRLCNDINGRFTMGRLALQLRKFLQTGEIGLWTQFSTPNFAHFAASVEKTLRVSGVGDVRTMITSPQTLGRRPTQIGTVLLAASSQTKLKAALQALSS